MPLVTTRAARAASILSVLAGAPAVIHAQQLRPVSVDVTVGAGGGVGGGERAERGGAALETLVGVRVRALSRGALMAGVSAGFQGPLGGSDVCHLGSRGQCLDDFPMLGYVAVLGGWEGARTTGPLRGATARVLGGPAFVHVEGDDAAAPQGNTVAAQGRLDLATPPLGPVALVASFRGAVVPRFHGQALGIWGYALGVRLR